MALGTDGADYGQVLVGGRDRNNALRPQIVDTDGKLVGVYQADPNFIEQPCIDVTTAAATVLLAAIAGRRHYITDIVFENTGASAIRVQVFDDTTRIYSVTVPPGTTFMMPLMTPLRGGTNKAMNIVMSAAGTVTVSTQGYNAVA